MGKELFKNIPSKVGDLVKDVRNGRIGLPDLQRPFVWRDNKVRELFDSMLKGYPIGYIMLWESPVDYESKKSAIGDNSKTYEEPKELVIDGQQRLTALVAAMYAVKVKDKNFADREIKISYNPLTREFAVWSQAYEKDTEWISRISDVFLAKEDNSISSLRRHFIKEANEGRGKKELPLLTDEEEDRIEDNINALLNLSDYSLPTLEISYTADEEDVADIFVRVNSGGQSLTENNFIQTLISVYENETSNKINAFAAASRVPAANTSYNTLLAIEPSHLIRMAVGVGFKRARLRYAYMLLRGKNLETGKFSDEVRHENLQIFKDALDMTFALATGVGKTRLMGAFIAYLYTQHHIRNFFVVAPNTTIFEKLKKDLSDNNSAKYVFKGLGCFSTPPQIITDDDYREKTLSLFESDVHIFVYNIDKFNKEGANMKKVNELIGDSFYQALSDLPDLVLIMDESHHYRAEKGAQALNELHPLLGLELTATPLVTKGNKQVPFKNVVYEYPLSKAIEDGYTRTPYAVTRSDIDFYNFGDEQLDKMMLLDGITCHESTKRKLEVYAANHGKPVVKPFMLVVCKDTDHATWVEQFVKSDEFRSGAYRNKTIIVHSKQKGAETEANTRLLLDVENPKNPVEIVIHVNMLKEGWDVNNLYTIVPLRTAASKILREQMVGRGLRLPYGERTGDRDVDAVMLTAHDKFNDILAEAQKGDSIFKAGNVIKAEEIKPEEVVYTQLTIETNPDAELEKAYAHTQIEKTDTTDALIKKAADLIKAEVEQHIQHTPAHTVTPVQAQQIVETVKQKVAEDKDLGQTFKENEMPLAAWMLYQTEETHRAAVNKFIPIPRIKVTDAGVEEYVFVDFDLDMADFTHVPIKNELLVQNLEDMQDRQRIKGDAIDFEGYNPKKVILEQLRAKPEIDYEKCSKLLFKLITQVCDHYETRYGTNGMQNIIMMYKRDIGNKIYKQMLQHFYCENGFLQEEVVGTRDYNLQQSYSCAERVNLFSDNYTGNIQSVLFEGVKRGVFSAAKFDSRPELVLARVLETDTDVQNWLRPAPQEFNITYNHGHNYEPDFVVETDDTIYLVEVKGEDKLSDPDVIAKKKRGIQYCEVASRWGKANGYKQWKYLFIPSKQIMPNSSFMQLAKMFQTM